LVSASARKRADASSQAGSLSRAPLGAIKKEGFILMKLFDCHWASNNLTDMCGLLQFHHSRIVEIMPRSKFLR
jgi:hypothetical protein